MPKPEAGVPRGRGQKLEAKARVPRGQVRGQKLEVEARAEAKSLASRPVKPNITGQNINNDDRGQKQLQKICG